ncbi:MAG: sigma 54-interacting transcriptional regulator [Thermodesulfobacteriota bacterium]
MEKEHPLRIFSHNRKHLDWQAFSRMLLNGTRDGVLAVDTDGLVLFSNQAAKEGLNVRSGLDLRAALPGFWPEVERTLRDRQYRFGISVQKGGQAYLAKLSPLLWKTASIGVLCVFENRTELEEVNRRMLSFQELNRELDTIIDTSFDGLWICDADANVIRINPASERINNIEAPNVIDRNMRDLVGEGFIDQSVTLEVIRTRSVINMLQQTKTGRKLMLTGNPVFDTEGRLIRVVVNERDITEIDRLYRELDEQTAFRDEFRNRMLEMQLEELESKRIIAKSPCMINSLRQALKVSAVDSTVLILGESGVGKGLIARMIRKYSDRRDAPMIEINCGAIPETLLEAELFGYEKGAFTGAGTKGKPGYFELADGGILLLDEIAELPLSSQVKLLRFLEDGQVSRIGGTQKRKVDVRILAATNRNLEEMVEQGKFRLDLYYRLNVIPIRVPPLRERRDCILPLIHHYMEYFGEKLNIHTRLRFTPRAHQALQGYDYPGNVRELMNLCERIMVMAEGPRIDLEDLPGDLIPERRTPSVSENFWREGHTLAQALQEVEIRILRQAIEKYRSQAAAAEALGVNQSTVARKLRRYGI